MVSHALEERPNECCGLLAGSLSDDQAFGFGDFCYRLVNEQKSPTEFLSEPKDLLSALKNIKAKGIEVLAIYHSHPTSAPIPSKRDLEMNWSPNVMNLIIGLNHEAPDVRAWWLNESGFHPGQVEMVDR